MDYLRDSNGVRITNINQRRLESRRKKQLQRKKKVVTIAATGIIALSTLLGIHGLSKDDTPRTIPEGYMKVYTVEQVNYGDTLTDIAAEYYDEELYGEYYKNINEYIKEIAKTNNINANKINPYTNLIIPAITEENNIYIEQIKSIDAEIEKVRQNEYWIDHTVEYGDTILGLSYLGAGDDNEAYNIQYKIMDKNNLKSSSIQKGQILHIVNPKLGELKKERQLLQEKMHNSLKVNQEEETKTY